MKYFLIEFLYFQIRKYKENIHVSRDNIYYFLFLKYLYKKLSFQKIIHLKHITMKKKKGYYHSFQTYLESQSNARLGSLIMVSLTMINLSQCKNKKYLLLYF
jgi:hypothetical protein